MRPPNSRTPSRVLFAWPDNDLVRRCRGFGYGIGARRGRLPSQSRIGSEAEPPDALSNIEQQFECAVKADLSSWDQVVEITTDRAGSAGLYG